MLNRPYMLPCVFNALLHLLGNNAILKYQVCKMHVKYQLDGTFFGQLGLERSERGSHGFSKLSLESLHNCLKDMLAMGVSQYNQYRLPCPAWYY